MMFANRTRAESVFLIFFLPIVVTFYLIYKYPTFFVPVEQVKDYFFFAGKSLSFWYSTLYTLLVVVICLWVLYRNHSPYSQNKNLALSRYQKWKWISIMFSQFIAFYIVPFVLPYIISGKPFWNDDYVPLNKDAYIYVYNGFTSLGGLVYIFILVPLVTWFFGKRYCAWFCACGNLAETIGVTPWGLKWVEDRTPRSEGSRKAEWLQFVFLILAICYGMILFVDGLKVFGSSNIVEFWTMMQDLIVDLIFGALIGVGAYPFFGTRIWCRYGCPMAQLMLVFGKLTKSRTVIKGNDKCRGIGLCTKSCPMGIDVESFVHKDKRPIMGSWGLDKTPCIGCGACIDVCPVKALEFKKIFGEKKNKSS